MSNDTKNEHKYHFSCATCSKKYFILDTNCTNCNLHNTNALYQYLKEAVFYKNLLLLLNLVFSIPGIAFLLLFFIIGFIIYFGSFLVGVFLPISLIIDLFLHPFDIELLRNQKDIYILKEYIGFNNYYIGNIVLAIISFIVGMGVFIMIHLLNIRLMKGFQAKGENPIDIVVWLSFILIPFLHILYKVKYNQRKKLYQAAKILISLNVIDNPESERATYSAKINSEFMLYVYGEFGHKIKNRIQKIEHAVSKLFKTIWVLKNRSNNSNFDGESILELLEEERIIELYQRWYFERQPKYYRKEIIDGMKASEEDSSHFILCLPPEGIADTYDFIESDWKYVISILICISLWIILSINVFL